MCMCTIFYDTNIFNNNMCSNTLSSALFVFLKLLFQRSKKKKSKKGYVSLVDKGIIPMLLLIPIFNKKTDHSYITLTRCLIAFVTRLRKFQILRQRAKLLPMSLWTLATLVLQQHSLVFSCFVTLQVKGCTTFANSDVSCVKSAL